MKKTLILGTILALILLFLEGCNSGSKVTQQDNVQSNNLLIGTWQYYEDIPNLPYKKSWILKFTLDGNYTTSGDDVWGNGTYILSEDEKFLSLKKSSNGMITDYQIEIKEIDGVWQLIYLTDDRSEPSTTSISQEKTYYTIFEKIE